MPRSDTSSLTAQARPDQARPDRARRGRFVVVAGIDGAGKSTISRGLVQALGAAGQDAVLLPSRHAAPPADPPFLARHLERVQAAVWETDGDDRQDLFGHRHYFLLLAAWYEALDRLVLRPALDAGRTVVSDGWTHKLLARSMERPEITAGLVGECFGQLARPDLTLFLDVPAETCAARKETISRTEAGQHDGYAGDRRTSFVDYQTRIRANLLAVSQSQGPTRLVDASRPPAEVTGSCLHWASAGLVRC
ncbi:dTMP kinase [Jatrophihabitans sp.]|uniref:dTMP kinase n=1 Tax=Jatrophihabitans sp. TaxID=1932789 RepID=UPI002B77F738|nr:dTMP kinase [Jatrophihabitans sp.]